MKPRGNPVKGNPVSGISHYNVERLHILREPNRTEPLVSEIISHSAHKPYVSGNQNVGAPGCWNAEACRAPSQMRLDCPAGIEGDPEAYINQSPPS